MALRVRQIDPDRNGNCFTITGAHGRRRVAIATKTEEDAYAIVEAYKQVEDPKELQRLVDLILSSASCVGGQMPQGTRWLYHVTFVNRLPVIKERGLLPIMSSRPTQVASPGVVDEQEGRIFFTEPRGVGYWFGQLTQVGAARSLEPISVGHVPVVLRVRIEPGSLYPDALGTTSSRARAWYGSRVIHPSEIQAWDGSRWVHPHGWGKIRNPGQPSELR